jgi:hypothetical protein
MGNLRVWWCAIRELITVALPCQRSNPSVLVPVLSFATSTLTGTAEIWIGMHQAPRLDVAMLPSEILLVVLLPSLLNAFVALIVTRFCARCSFITLRLE